ncbi:MAG: hypothetical protein ACE5JP_16460 [Candidatus Bipolaricaulia bacterium]
MRQVSRKVKDKTGVQIAGIVGLALLIWLTMVPPGTGLAQETESEGEGATHLVTLIATSRLLTVSISIEPESLTISVGDTVIWRNESRSGLYSSGPSITLASETAGFEMELEPEESFSFTFVELGRHIINVDSGEMVVEVIGAQELALIHSSLQMLPDRVVVRKGVPVRLYNVAVEGVHRLSLAPLVAESFFVRPGEVIVVEFTPEQTGTFEIRNLSRGFSGTLIVKGDG